MGDIFASPVTPSPVGAYNGLYERGGQNMCVTMEGTVLSVDCGDLLVRDCETCQEVTVLTEYACDFSAGDCVRVVYNGAMTRTLPPQITATCIKRIACC